MPRRTVFALGLILSVWSMALSLVAEAQQAGKVYRIGALSLTSFDNTTLATVTIEGLGRLGYVVGRSRPFSSDRRALLQLRRVPALPPLATVTAASQGMGSRTEARNIVVRFN